MKMNYLVVLSILCVVLFSCRNSNGIEIQSTNLSLKEANNSKVILVDDQGKAIVDGIMGFSLSRKFFFGWSKHEQIKYFAVNLSDNKPTFFNSLGELNAYLKNQNQPQLHMENETTYWDLKKQEIRIFSQLVD